MKQIILRTWIKWQNQADILVYKSKRSKLKDIEVSQPVRGVLGGQVK